MITDQVFRSGNARNGTFLGTSVGRRCGVESCRGCVFLFFFLSPSRQGRGAGQAVVGIFCLSFALAAVGGVSVVSGWLRGLEPVWAVADGCGCPLVKNVDKVRAMPDSEGRLCGLSFGRGRGLWMPLRAQVCLVGGGPVLAIGQTCALRRAQVCSQGGRRCLSACGCRRLRTVRNVKYAVADCRYRRFSYIC